MQQKLIILMVFGGILFVISLQSRTPSSGNHNQTSQQLHWNGLALTSVSDENQSNTPANSPKLPVNLAPLFFKPIPINSATPDLLMTIPGVGPKLAYQIECTKKERGRFETPSDLLSVKGIGPIKSEYLKEYLSFD